MFCLAVQTDVIRFCQRNLDLATQNAILDQTTQRRLKEIKEYVSQKTNGILRLAHQAAGESRLRMLTPHLSTRLYRKTRYRGVRCTSHVRKSNARQQSYDTNHRAPSSARLFLNTQEARGIRRRVRGRWEQWKPRCQHHGYSGASFCVPSPKEADDWRRCQVSHRLGR